MRIRSTIFALAAVAWTRRAGPAWAIAGCDAFPNALRAEASDMQVEFGRAVVVSRTRSDSNVFDVTTKVDVDGTLRLPRRRVPALRGAHRRTGERPHDHEFRAFSDGGAEGGAGLGRRQEPRRPARHEPRTRAEYLAASRQRGDVYVAGKTEEHEPGGVSLGLMATGSDRTFVIVGPAGQ